MRTPTSPVFITRAVSSSAVRPVYSIQGVPALFHQQVVSQPHGVLQIGGHAFKSVHYKLFERAEVFVLLAQHAHCCGFGVVVGACAGPFQFVGARQCYSFGFGPRLERVAHFESPVNASHNALVVEVCVCNCAEQGVGYECVGFFSRVNVVLAQVVGRNGYSPHYEQQQVHVARSESAFPAHSF